MNPIAFDLCRLRQIISDLADYPPESLQADFAELADAHKNLGELLARVLVREAAE